MTRIPPGFDYIALGTRSKVPLQGVAWNTAPSLTEDEVLRILRQGGNYGLRLGPNDVVFDVDPRNGGDVKMLDAYCDRSLYPTVDTPAGGAHIVMRLPDGVKVKSIFSKGIDIKHVGGYVVGIGSTHPNGGVYEHDFMTPWFPAPMIPDALLEQITLSSNPTHLGVATWTPTQLCLALSKIDPRNYAAHDTWFALMCACHEATGGEGEDEFASWSIQDELYSQDEKVIRARWQSLKAGDAGNASAGTLLHILAAAGVLDLGFETDEFAAYAVEPTAPIEKKTPLQDMNERFHVVQEDGKLRILELRESEDLRVKHWIRHSRQDFLEICKSIYHFPPVEVKYSTPEGKDRTKLVPMAERWIDNPVRGKRTYPGGIVFMPEVQSEKVGDSLNLWRGFAFEPKQGDWSLLQQLVREVLCRDDVESYEYVINWLARAVQYPHIPAGVAVVFKGIKGTGKGTLGRSFAKLFGTHGKHVASMNAISGRFNAHLQDCVAMFADEAYWAGDRAAEGIFQALITEPTLHYEAKGLNPKTGRNCIHCMMASNRDWVVPAGLDAERRYAVFETLEEIKDYEFFQALNVQLENGGYEAMLYDLMNRDISTFRVQRIPNTEALAEQKIESMDVIELWMHKLLSNEWDGVEALPNGPTHVLILAHDLQNSFEKHLGRRIFSKSIEMTVGHAVKRFLKAKRSRIAKPTHRVDLTTERPWAYDLPSLHYARGMFNRMVGQDVFGISRTEGRE